MSVILRNKIQERYTVVSQNITTDQRLDLKSRGLLVTLLSLPDNWIFSIEGLTSIVADGKDAIRSALQKLEKYGYLERKGQERLKNGRLGNSIWIIHERPADTICPSLTKPLLEKPPADIATQSNTNISNTNISNTNY